MRRQEGRRWSLRRTLLSLLLGLTIALWASSAAIVYVEARQESHELFDQSLAETANLLLSLVGNEVREHGYIKLPMQGHPNPDRYLLFQVHDADGRMLYQNAGAPDAGLSSALPDGFSWGEIEGRRWRFYSLWDHARSLQLVVAEPTTHREDISSRFFYKILAFGTPNELLDVELDGIPSEAFPLIQSINRLFGRLRRTMEYEQRFTADAAHELRTPLAAIKTNLQVLQRARSVAERDEFIAALGVSVDRASRLVDQLLTLARLDPQGETGLALLPGDLADLLREEGAAWQAASAQLGLNLRLAIARAPCVLETDSIRMLLRNLVDNALRYTPAPGTVEIACGQEYGRSFLRVRDSGPGIPTPMQERVFERFVRLAGAHQPGSGLGLSIVRRIADRHEALIGLGPGLGASGLAVTVAFPAAPPPAADER